MKTLEDVNCPYCGKRGRSWLKHGYVQCWYCRRIYDVFEELKKIKKDDKEK